MKGQLADTICETQKSTEISSKITPENEISKILDLLMKDLENRLEGKNVKLKLTNEAKDYLIDSGYDEIYGARPLKRFVQKKLETLIARKILLGEILPNTKIVVDYKNSELTIN